MANVKGEDEIAFFEREIEDFCTELRSIVSEQITQSRALRDSCREFIKALSGKKALCSSYLCFFQITIMLKITEIIFHFREMVQEAERNGPDD